MIDTILVFHYHTSSHLKDSYEIENCNLINELREKVPTHTIAGFKHNSFQIRFSLSLDMTIDIDFICRKLSDHQSSLDDIGLLSIMEIEFVLEYKDSISWTLSSKQLALLKSISDPPFGISFNSINTHWPNEKEGEYQVIYYQLIFNEINDSTYIQKICKKYLFPKYQMLLYTDARIESLTVSIKEDLEMYSWREISDDLLMFCRENQIALKALCASVSFGFYQYNRSDMSGGEIGKELLNPIIELGLPLIITMNTEQPTNSCDIETPCL